MARMRIDPLKPANKQHQVGEVYGRLTILEFVKIGGKRHRYARCLCVCGKEVTVTRSNLYSGGTKSCGCLKVDWARARHAIGHKLMAKKEARQRRESEATGRKYGRLTIIGFKPWSKSEPQCCQVRCECGNEGWVTLAAVESGKTRSCGCLKRELAAVGDNNNDEDILYKMIMRAYFQGAEKRGLEWTLSSDEFRALVRQNCYYCGRPPGNIKKLHRKTQSIEMKYSGVDRVDNNKGYIVSNCVPCCAYCNKAKLDSPVADFVAWLDQLVTYRQTTIDKEKEVILSVAKERQCQDSSSAVQAASAVAKPA
jgi:hypothetical protein